MKKTIILLLVTTGLTFAQPLTELQPILEVKGTDSGAGLGYRPTGIGDINKDGYADVAVRVFNRYVTQIYLGGNPMSSTPAFTLYGNTQIVNGDFNGDGWIDFALSREYSDTVLIYFGSLQMDTIPDVILTGKEGGISFGLTLTAGDINNDGYDDLVIGAQEYTPSENLNYRLGKIYVYAGAATIDTIPILTYVGEKGVNERFGHSMAAGDVNNDGRTDIVVFGKVFQGNKAQLKMSVFLGKSDFQLNQNYFCSAQQDTTNSNEFDIEIFDADGDGIKDIVLAGIFIYIGGDTIDTLPKYRVNTPKDYESFFGNFPRVWGGGIIMAIV